jgi:hypothetical protein
LWENHLETGHLEEQVVDGLLLERIFTDIGCENGGVSGSCPVAYVSGVDVWDYFIEVSDGVICTKGCRVNSVLVRTGAMKLLFYMKLKSRFVDFLKQAHRNEMRAKHITRVMGYNVSLRHCPVVRCIFNEVERKKSP